MKSRTVIILWIVAALLGIAAYVVKFHGGEDNSTRTTLTSGQKVITNLPIREVTQVTLSRGQETTTLNRTDENGEPAWSIAERGDYVINYELLRNLLGALGEIEVVQGYPATPEHYGRFGLASNNDQVNEASEEALQVTITGSNGETLSEVFFGKFSGTQQAGGRFIRLGHDDSGVYAVGERFPGVTASPKDWLGKDFIKIEQIKDISASAPSDPAFQSWTVVRPPKIDGSFNPTGQFTLQGMTENEVMQLTSTNPLRNLFSFSAFQDVLSKEEAAKTAHPDAKLKRQAIITTLDGFTYTLHFWPQKAKPKDPAADPRLPAVQPSYLLTIDVRAEQQSSRIKSTDETPDITKAKDDKFLQAQQALRDKLAAAQIFKGRIYLVSQSTIAPLQKERSSFIKTKNKPAAASPAVQVPATQAPALPPLPPRP